ncbi:hypothetical protein BCV72DRAFT_217411 [Rhizopus microsporus var. microsporus]|uniref:BTB domain-containing protein n=1 Tax=Rhizopus microsporus var. microsporus TaxID=86635 RepID=A0A1X0QNP7_RHIZD|nr:hypothetical protein BCV72DRAFT_217411 [Rhizopus microsporus var. microsporus]
MFLATADEQNESQLFQELCTAAREGDIEQVENLVKHFNAPINYVDEWQCSPLYWACLCGHYAIVKYLLESGAQCDRNTFQGNLLLSYKLTKAVDEDQPYLLYLTQLFESHAHHDLTFQIPMTEDHHEFYVHKFILAARSPYFGKNLLNRWSEQDHVKLQRNLVHPMTFSALLRYIYTGYIDYALDNDILDNMLFAAKHLEFHHLHSLLLEQKSTNDALRSHSKQEIIMLRHDFEKFYIGMITVAMRAEPQQERTWIMIEPWAAESLECSPKSIFADIAIKLHNNIIFPCHKAYLCRVELFNTMLSGPFGEQDAKLVTLVYPGQTNLVLPLIELYDVDADIFGYYILQFIYTDKCNIPAEDAYDVLLVADMLLIDRLKAMAAIVITNQKEPIIDIYELIQTAIELQVERVEQYCIKYFAHHLDDFIHQPQFLNLIKQSAASIKKREETDSIPFIDDLRYFLTKEHFIAEEDLNELGRVNDEYQETWTELETLYNQKLEMLDQALSSLGLEA